MENKKTTIEALMEQGKANGKLTTKEITDALEDLDFDVEQINTFYDNCENLNIEIVEDMNVDADLKIGMDSSITDDLEMGAADIFPFRELGVRAVEGGADLVLVCHEYAHQQDVYNGLLTAVQNGTIPESRIDESVRRILRAKMTLAEAK